MNEDLSSPTQTNNCRVGYDDGTLGQAVRNHLERGITVHLFVRAAGKTNGRATPFIYCGDVDFIDWEGEKPITVRWQLRDSLPQRLQEVLAVPSLAGS